MSLFEGKETTGVLILFGDSIRVKAGLSFCEPVHALVDLVVKPHSCGR